jgi:MFS family permease
MMQSRYPRAALMTIVVEGFLGRLTFGMVTFALPLYARSLGLSLAEVGVLVSLRAVVELALKPPAGWLADRIGVRRVYLGGGLARVFAAAALLLPGGILGLATVRALQGVSGAGRDVASLGVIARDAPTRIGGVFGWYTSARQIGNVAGAGVAGVMIAAAGGAFEPLWLLVMGLSVLPMAAVWIGLREIPAAHVTVASQPEASLPTSGSAAHEHRPTPTSGLGGGMALVRELAAPASVGMLVSTGAFMVHGLFPVLATEYAGLSDEQAGLIYSLSAVVLLVSGPGFGWLIDRYGRLIGLAWRSTANIGSSFLYLASPTFVGLALARAVDDSGKAAFRPAWAAAMAQIANADPRRSGQRLGVLDASQSVGETIGPILAGILWESGGGVVVLFGVRIAIALAAELMSLYAFGELRGLWARKPHQTGAGLER